MNNNPVPWIRWKSFISVKVCPEHNNIMLCVVCVTILYRFVVCY